MRRDDDIAAEIRQHLEEKIAALEASGLSTPEARRAAHLEFGNALLLTERSRAVWRCNALADLVGDLRFALRQFRRSPSFSLAVVLILALGIGVNTAIFSIVRQVLLAPLPYPHPEQLMAIWASSESQGHRRVAASGPDLLDYQEGSRSFSHLAVVIPHFTFTWVGDGEPKLVNCTAVSPDFFPMLGIRPLLGRLYEPADYATLENGTIVVSYRFWRNQLGGDPHVIGRVLHFNHDPVAIVGVLPPLPDLFADADVWPTLSLHPSWPFMQWRSNKFLTLIGRLRPAARAATAEQELSAILRRGAGEPADARVQLVPLRDDLVGGIALQLRVAMGAVALVLLVACVNVAALMLARSLRRGPEMALRLSLGARRGRLSRQLLAESALLVGAAAVLGVAGAAAGLRLLGRVAGLQLPRIDGIGLDGSVLAFTVAIAAAATLFLGWLPSLAFAALDLAAALRGGRSGGGQAHRRWFALLVIAEIAGSVVLAVGAGLLLHSFWNVLRVRPGFQPESLMTAYLRTNYDSPAGRPFWNAVLQNVGALPGVRATALADCTPGRFAPASTVFFDDRPNDPQRLPAAQGCWISAEFFRTSGTRLLAGRPFDQRDGAEGAPTAIVNNEAARLFWPRMSAVGRHLGVNYIGAGRRSIPAPRLRTVVGVVEGIKQGALDTPTLPAIYLPYLQDETSHNLAGLHLFVRSEIDPASLIGGVRAAVQAARADEPVTELESLREVIAETLAPRRYSLFLLAAFASLAILLAALGVYGLAAYTTAERRRELALRMALGASRGDVMSGILRQGLALAAAGGAAGGLAAVAAGRALASLLFEIGPLDAASFAAAIGGLTVISLGACALPAWRAAQAEPASTLRAE